MFFKFSSTVLHFSNLVDNIYSHLKPVNRIELLSVFIDEEKKHFNWLQQNRFQYDSSIVLLKNTNKVHYIYLSFYIQLIIFAQGFFPEFQGLR